MNAHTCSCSRQFHKLGCIAKIPRIVLDKFIQCIEAGIKDTKVDSTTTGSLSLRTAVDHQNEIGNDKLLQGFLAKAWANAIGEWTMDKIQHKVTFLLRQLWDTLFTWVWDTRNFILHHTPNCYRAIEGLQKSYVGIWRTKMRSWHRATVDLLNTMK
jgi:hypothetical protein